MTNRRLEAIIEHQSDEKYVVMEVGNPEESRMVLVSLPLWYHSDIVREFYRRINGEAIRVLGGGILEISPQERRIRTYGMSGSYGRPDKSLVENILRANFPDYSLDVRVTDYVRG